MALNFGTPGRNETTIVNDNGTELNIDNSGNLSVEFPSVQSVRFDSAQDVNVSFPLVQTVDFNGTQNVQFPNAQSVQFDSAQNVTVDSGTVTISGSPTVDITGQSVFAVQSGAYVITGEVTFPSAQNVNIASTSGAIDVSAATVDIDIQNSTIDIFSTSDNVEQHKIAVTDSNTTQAWTNVIKSFIFLNNGDSIVHVNFDANATTNHFPILPHQTFSLDFNPKFDLIL